MKTCKSFLLFLIAAVFLGVIPRASARVSFEFFYDNLEPYGEWVDVADYGYCWHPTGVEADWAPYSDGYWAYTDEGWTWVSYEDFGGITYHYGRWVRLEDEGWCWVPDYEWAPAWVSWRSSDDYIGWAPLPPRARFHRDTGFSVSVDVDYDIGPTYYNFCEYRHFGDPALRGVIIDRSRNMTIINRTTNITNITVNRTTNNVFVGGPQYRIVEQRSARPVQVLRLRRETDNAAIQAAGRRTLARQQGNQLVVLAPDVIPADAKFKPAQAAKNIAAPKVDHGWRGVTDPVERQQLETKFKSEAKGRQHAAAHPVQAQDLKVVEEKAAATSAPGAVNPPAAPAAVVTGKKGQNKKRPAVAAESVAPANIAPTDAPTLAPAGAKSREGKAAKVTASEPTNTETGTTPNLTPFVKGKNKHAKVPADISAQSTEAPVIPAKKKEKRAPAVTQPFVTDSETPERNLQREVPTQETQSFAPEKAGQKEKKRTQKFENQTPKSDAVRRESLPQMAQPKPERGPQIQSENLPLQSVSPQGQGGKKAKKDKKDDKKKDRND